jgi:hypothetical protein
MQLRNLKFWKQPEVELTASDSNTHQREKTSNVIDIPLETPLDSPAGLSGVLPMSDSMYLNLKTKPLPKGPMAAKELTEFFSKNFINCGRYAGVTQQTQEAREQGLSAVISQFQNVIELVIDEKRSKLDSLLNQSAQTEGVSDIVSTQLHLAREKLDRDVLVLKEQFELSRERKGWVLAALNEFRIGFDRGLRDAINAELLGL